MKRKQLRRLLTGVLTVGLAAFGLAPLAASAHAADRTNLAQGRPASATGAIGGYPVSNVTDGNQGSYWEGPSNVFPQSVRVDLGESATVDEVVLQLPDFWEARTETLSVEGSADGTSYSTLAASQGRQFAPGGSAPNTVSLDIASATARYVRVTITANTGWPAAQLSELQVYGTASTDPGDGGSGGDTGGGTGGDDGGDDPGDGGSTDLAHGRPAEASSHTQDYTAEHTTDGQVGTYWESAGFPADLTAKLGADADLTSVVVKLNPDPIWGPRTQNIQVLGRDQDDAGFTSLAAAASYRFDPASNQNSVRIPVHGRAADVRLAFTGNTGAPGAQVAEFQVFGTAAPNPDLTVTGVSWSPSAPVETDSTTVSATVRNSGTAASPASTLNVSVGGVVAGTASVGALAAGASTTVSVSIGKRAMGSYTVSAAVDPTDAVIELDDANNSLTAPDKLVVAQSPGPDLQVLGITANPANPSPGQAVSFTVAVHNRGTTASGATTVTRVAVGGTTLDTDTPSVAAGATRDVHVSGTWTAASGGATITATADATNAVTETNEGNNTYAESIVVGRGAALPFTEYEAEDGTYNGTLLTTDPLRTFGHTNFATESSGRASVRLDSTGQYVQFTSTVPTNSIVVRNSIPDAPSGGGAEATISLYANGTFVRKLTLSSVHSWLYGSTDAPEGLTNTPGGDARRLFDETSALLNQTYPAGTTFRLQRDATDTASYYILDLVDLEQVAPPKAKPAECTSITEYGAVPDDGIDDTSAIQQAVMDDQNGVINCVWIPPGQWRQEQKVLTPDPLHRGQYNQVGISHVSIRGAGMWYSQFYTLTQPQDAHGINHPHEGNFGFDIDGDTQISDIAIFGSGRIRGGDGNAEGGVGLNGRFGENTKISNVWIEHSNVGVWVGRDYDNIPALWGPADGLEFSGMRIRDTYADGINFTNGTRNSTVFNSSFRTTGDDSLAVWASKYVKDQSVDIGHDNHFTNNTVQLPWRANGVAIYGGYGNTVENNLIYDTMNYPGIMLATDHDPMPFSGQTLIANNALYRTGGAFWGEQQEFGAITLFPSTRDITGVTIRDTDIYDSTYDGIQFKTGGGNMPDVAISNVTIDKSNNGAGIRAQGGARGSATLTDVTITNSADGDVLVEPGSQFKITGTPNS